MEVQRTKITPYYLIAYDTELEERYISYFDSFEELMHHAASLIAYDDIYLIEIDEISAEDYKIAYTGWRPGMRMVFKTIDTKEVVWDQCYPEWDH